MQKNLAKLVFLTFCIVDLSLDIFCFIIKFPFTCLLLLFDNENILFDDFFSLEIDKIRMSFETIMKIINYKE